MGLDSVELIVSVEEKFGINITDAECEKIATVQDFVEKVFEKISIAPSEKCLSQIIFYRIRTAFEKLNLSKNEITPNAPINELLSVINLKENWHQIETESGLKLPELVKTDFNPSLDSHVKILGFRTFKRSQPVTKGTMRQLVDWVISLNFEEIIDIEKITSKYEVERVISGMISDSIGIPISEIELRHTLAGDLGID